jgi:5'-nucleotidase
VRTTFLRSAALALAMTTAVAGCAIEGDPNQVAGREVRLTLLHTADWHSRLFPYQQQVSATDAALGLQQSKAPFGGAARMNWLIQRERAHADRVLHLDSGDCFQGAPIFNFFGGEAEVRALNHTGVDAVVVGNHEFDRGALNFGRQFSRWATFPVLAANYLFDDPTTPGSAELGRLVKPYHIFNVRGLKVAVIGFGNLSSITSLFDQPNRTGITPLNTREVAQFYLDTVINQGADFVVGVSHLGLEDDHRMVEQTTGFDVILGGHLHIVLNPPQELEDCQPFNARGEHFVPELVDRTQQSTRCDENAPPYCCSASGVCAPEPTRARSNPEFAHWRLAPGFAERRCRPRRVVLQHSGAFMKYLGRLDLVLSDDPERIGEARRGDAAPDLYDARNRFEIVGHRFTLFPVDSTVPEEPTMARLLEPYARALDTLANLDTLVGYSPTGVSRTNEGGGDSPMGNLVTTAMWRRLGIQTDFAMTNTLGIRDAIPPGPVTIDQVYNVFPFDNSITTMLVSGREVRELFDFVARRSSGRGCNSQAQIAGARVVITCGSCDRNGDGTNDTIEVEPGRFVPVTACAETINIGLARTVDDATQMPTGVPERCDSDADCNPTPRAPEARSLCEPNTHRCMQPLSLNASYALAANDYIAAGGSGFFVLQRNTTQSNTFVQLRDAVVDHVQAGNPCGYDPVLAETFRNTHPDQPHRRDDGLHICQTDADCGDPSLVCSCRDRITWDATMRVCSAASNCAGEQGRCVLRACRDDVARLVAQDCPAVNPPDDPTARERCLCSAQSRGGESCRILSCFDATVGADADGRLRMVSRQ